MRTLYLFSLIVPLLASCSVGKFSPNTYIFQPPKPQYSTRAEGVFLIESKRKKKVACYHRPARDGKPTILWSHGNAEDMASSIHHLEPFRLKGYGVFAYDYPGYGLSQGLPTEQGCYENAEAAWRFLTSVQKVDKNKVVLVGQSVGSGPSTWLATQVQPAGLVLIAPFKSAFRVVTGVPLLPGDKFENIKRISQVDSSLLVIHGEEDRVIPQSHGKALYKRHRGQKEFYSVQGAGHNDLFFVAPHEIRSRVIKFAENLP